MFSCGEGLLWCHAASLGPGHAKGLLPERCTYVGNCSLMAGSINGVDRRTDDLAQRFGCSPELCCIKRCLLFRLQRCQVLQAGCDVLFMDIALQQQG